MKRPRRAGKAIRTTISKLFLIDSLAPSLSVDNRNVPFVTDSNLWNSSSSICGVIFLSFISLIVGGLVC